MKSKLGKEIFTRSHSHRVETFEAGMKRCHKAEVTMNDVNSSS